MELPSVKTYEVHQHCFTIFMYTVDGVDFQLLFDGIFTVTQEIGFFCFEIGIISDTLVEGGEFFTLALTTQADYVILDPNNTTVLINDDEGSGLLLVSW